MHELHMLVGLKLLCLRKWVLIYRLSWPSYSASALFEAKTRREWEEPDLHLRKRSLGLQGGVRHGDHQAFSNWIDGMPTDSSYLMRLRHQNYAVWLHELNKAYLTHFHTKVTHNTIYALKINTQVTKRTQESISCRVRI